MGLQRVSNYIPPEVRDHIRSVPIPANSTKQDNCAWGGNIAGQYTVRGLQVADSTQKPEQHLPLAWGLEA